VYDRLSIFRETPVPFDEWIDHWDPSVNTYLFTP
jgi:hypothetical protein